MELNYGAIMLASVIQFVIGGIWYMPMFGDTWGKIHGFDRKSKEAQAAMKKGMAPLLGVQFLVTIVTTSILALFMQALPHDWNAYGMAGFFWLGFVLPTQISAVIFGGTDPKWVRTKISIAAGGSLVSLEAAAAVLAYLK